VGFSYPVDPVNPVKEICLVTFLCGLGWLGERQILKPNPSLAERQGRGEEQDQKRKAFHHRAHEEHREKQGQKAQRSKGTQAQSKIKGEKH